VKHSFTVSIARKPGLSDPEGVTTKKALSDLGFDGVAHVSFGRTITLDVDAATQDEAFSQVEAMCEKLLANPVMETYTIEASK
jgi:phosphoribosylformylglycinamidine synthase